ncbi:MAG: GIY-YIG nuclease family protein [Candidatus Methanomethylicia archaeon]|nr:GIY-YIG nuclease family protein [Candidatus Methanomethylicia archaeon]MCX8168876.1 GIY-YIG nuclease family protein [Candidatus Methanomethylicia archaeon]MDW7988608.1 GIY-YIG nuclease family protein [Nitrososphaerota archaeon]
MDLRELLSLNGGVYTLIIWLPKFLKANIGSLGLIDFNIGIYTYTGSALGGKFALYNRVSRHLSQNKRLRWHIDYFLSGGNTEIKAVCVSRSNVKFECKVSNGIIFKLNGIPIHRFGSTDCNCLSHLHYFGIVDCLVISNNIYNLYFNLGLNPILILLNH